MNDRPTLSEALALAQAQVSATTSAPTQPAAEAETLALLRVAALAHGIAPDAVERSFLQGGPLADLVRAVLGAEAGPLPKTRGRPRKLAETWDTFARVVLFMRRGFTQEEAIGRVATDTRTPETTVRDRFTRTRDRDGVSPDTVPDSLIGAYFSDPRAFRSTAKR